MTEPLYTSPEEALAATDDFYTGEGFSYSEDLVVEWLSSNIVLPQTGKVLDLCCGDGIWSRGIQLLNPDLELFGLDISTGAIGKARRIVGADAEHYVVGDAEVPLPWEPGTFDMIFARGPGLYNQHSMDHLDTIRVIEHWHSKLTPRGRLWSIFASTPKLMGSYTPMDEVKLPYNRAPRQTPTTRFEGGKYHHTVQSFLTPFWKARNLEISEYKFVRHQHVLSTRLVIAAPA